MSQPSMSRTEAGHLARARRKTARRRAFAASGIVILLMVVAFLASGLDGVALPWSSSGPAVPVPDQGSEETTPAASGIASETPVVEEPALPSGPTTITVAAAGDMIFDRKVKSLIQATNGEEPLEEVAAQLAAADIAVGNLESPLSDGGTRNADKDVTFRGHPDGVQSLALAGFDFLSLANNHVLDYGPAALADTIALLDDHGIGHAGAGMNKQEAWEPAVRDVNGTSVAFLSFSHILPAGFIATNEKAGLAQGRLNMDEVEDAIRAADARYDYVLVSFHWGVEYKDDCNADQVADGRRAVDAGADMVLSHHPHVIQGIERYGNAIIAYSLGDFVFDHYSRKTGEAFILDAELGPSGVGEVLITPVYLDGNGKPEYVTGSEAAVILERLKAISSPLGTYVEISGDTARVLP